ncbi:MAG: DNA-directed RNA polymerase subunit alpha [Gemmatimonadetes bacterium]|nr:DNA-directed RNA polymerase subunit alpha [Gemmatimonadota bacterium]
MIKNDFVLPSRVEKDTEKLTGSYGEFTIQPLERGFGQTLGSAIRRVLLSSLEGAAVWGVQVEEVLHEFSVLPGAVEDMSEIVMNLKRLVLATDPDAGPTVLRLSLDRRGSISAGDIDEQGGVRVLNPDLHLITMDEAKRLEMEIHVKRGRGFVPADQHESEMRKRIGFVAVDSLFNPVVRCNFVVENTRVGQRTDYDRLTLQVTTNGTINPEEAVAQAATIMRTHFEYFLSFEEPREEEEDDLEEKHSRLKELFARSVDELELSVRSGNCLKASNIRTLGDLVMRSESEMLKFRNFGKKSLNEISEILQRHGLQFGMAVKENDEGYELVDKEELKRLGETRFPEEIEGQYPKIDLGPDDEEDDVEDEDAAAAGEEE